MSTSFVKSYELECAEDEEIRHNDAAETRVASREPDLRELLEMIAAQEERIVALNAKVAQLAHANVSKHQDDKRRHLELLRAIDALRHSLSEPAVQVLGNRRSRSWPPEQHPFQTLGNMGRGGWPPHGSFRE